MKKVYFTVGSDDLVTSISYMKTRNPDEIEIELEDEHEFIKNPLIFRFRNGELFKDIKYQKEEIRKREERKNRPSIDSRIAALTFQQMNSEFEVSEVKESNASMMYQIMNSEFELMGLKDSNSGLMYQLMLKGVI